MDTIDKDLQEIGENLEDLTLLNQQLKKRYGLIIWRYHPWGWVVSRLHKAQFQKCYIGIEVLKEWFAKPTRKAKEFIATFN